MEFQRGLAAVLMGRETFEPALAADRWPWPDLGVFVLGSRRPEGTPEHVIVDRDPARLLEALRGAHPDATVHLVVGPCTVEAFRAIGALDQLGLIVMPRLLGAGLQLTPAVDAGARLELNHQRALPDGAVAIVYDLA